ncbi:hypothetical protein SAMN05421788_106130 [Filimonas lacunae]|uniref:Uncharacterized protein n=1 Tax=Filimonas lacunae TaxID=477680 RepID=A0A173MEN6_9BACT|nr:hypothetical protein [Filimonas lacunae]BAV06062.1 hypothetical protein FLA_2077 [Filimonas lacunae]SIT24477.1 hypothetical protein SAMN05421788_106130 [Filimonas lacunae]
MEENYEMNLKERVEKIRTALMYSSLSENIDMPTNIAETIRYEEGGTLWLMVKKCWTNVDEKFPVKLHYYKKGIPHFIKIEGVGQLAYLPGNIAVIKVQVTQHEMSDYELSYSKMVKAGWWGSVNQWMRENVSFLFKPEPVAA